MSEILFKNGRIVDGTGNPSYKADIVISEGKIRSVKQNITYKTERVIDVSGLIVAPGFIDLHTHSDRTIVSNNRATSSIMAGVTTEAVGNCGSSIYGFSKDYLDTLSDGYASTRGYQDNKIEWTDLKSYREKLSEIGIGINIVPFIGHNTIRINVMGAEGKGGEKIVPSESEMEDMKKLVKKAMNQGAYGITSGLRYTPGRNALADEVREFCNLVTEYGGCYMSHIRDSGRFLLEAVYELISICEKADIRGCLSHNKAVEPHNWGKPSEVIRVLKKARSRGIDVICDVYPWNYSSAANLGRWFISGWGRNLGIDGHYKPSIIDLDVFLNDLRNPGLWERIKREAQERYFVDLANNVKRQKTIEKWNLSPFEIINPKNFECITYSKTHPELVGKRFFEIAKILCMDDYWEAIRKLLLDDEGHTYTGGGGMCEEDIITILQFPACAFSTDGSTRDRPSTVMRPAHPRNYGSFAKVLQRYVREMNILSLEDAVRKMTSLPANFLGLSDRGYILPGVEADLTIFAADKIENIATYSEPDQYPIGIEYVVVNGKIAAEKGKRTDILAGKVLVKQQD